ncbi:metallophosphoesterase family protein [Caproiciproducens faecalis]|uniref:Phosphoesterase n=1 Tax=Caproiciproducens faecalis TaxID=2820301 RepID=A0ABS7DNH6_9FIRM|nr:metallophosphoesterase [Caproiciproducens faecalis]MBW7572854.1 metallophosphoesterase [Caproiciproducens faecalis]
MRILVVSDTHRDAYALREAILKQPTAEVVIHLGDGAEEAQEIKDSFPEKMFLLVRGNCDWGSTLPVEEDVTLGGKHIFFTHGYTYNVKYGLYTATEAARGRKADILLFGHTHYAMTDYEDGLYIMNPGSLNGSRGTYGIIDITNQGVVTNLLKI